MVLRFIAAAIILAMQLPAQQVEVEVQSDKDSSKKSHKVIAITSDDGSGARTYRRVIKDGKVVEESGDRGLLKNLDIDVKWGSHADRLKGLKDRRMKKSSSSRRIVIKDGKIIEESSDGDLPEGLEGMISELKEGNVFIGGLPGKGGKGLRWISPGGSKKFGSTWRFGSDGEDLPEDVQRKIEEALEGIEGLDGFRFDWNEKGGKSKGGGKDVFRRLKRSKASKGRPGRFPGGSFFEVDSTDFPGDIQERIEEALEGVEGLKSFSFDSDKNGFNLKTDEDEVFRFFENSNRGSSAKGRLPGWTKGFGARAPGELRSNSASDHDADASNDSNASSDLRKAKREMKRLQKRMRDLEKRLNKQASTRDRTDRSEARTERFPRFESLRRASR